MLRTSPASSASRERLERIVLGVVTAATLLVQSGVASAHHRPAGSRRPVRRDARGRRAAAGCVINGVPGNEELACSFGDLAKGATRTVHVQSPTTSASAGVYTTIGTAKGWNSPVLTDSASETVICVPLTGGVTHGKAYGASLGVGDVKMIDDLNKQESVATVADGLHGNDGTQLVQTVPGLATVTLIRDESTSELTATRAASTAKATTASVDLLDGMVTADALVGISRSTATATSASYNSTGSKIVNLRINGGDVVDVANPNTRILVPGDGGDVIASLVLYEESGSTSVGSHQSASHSVNMLHLRLLKPYAGFPAGFELIVGHASTDASLAAQGVCGS